MKNLRTVLFAVILFSAFVAEASVRICGKFSPVNSPETNYFGFIKRPSDGKIFYIYDLRDLKDLPDHETAEGTRTCVRGDVKSVMPEGHTVLHNVIDISTEPDPAD